MVEDIKTGTGKPADVNQPANTEVNIEDDNKEDSKGNTPPEGSLRWNDIYYKAKEGERRVKELETDLLNMRKHNEDLSEVLKVSIIKDDNSQPNDKDILKELKLERSKAAKDLDWDKVYELDDKIDEVKDNIKLVNTPKTDNVDQRIADTVTYNQEKQIISDFVSNHMPWMNKLDPLYDEVMADAAAGLDKRLIPEWRGSVSKRIEEVKNRIEKRFNFNTNKSMPNVQGVGSNISKDDLKVDLTDNEKRIAHNLFPEDKEAEKKYYEQKILIVKRRNAK